MLSQEPYRLAPSNGVILIRERSTFSAQRRLTATIASPSGPVPSANGAQPQTLQNWWRMTCRPKV
jgi:hypothetical protein